MTRVAGESASDFDAIRATARAYLDGMVYADEAKLRSAFHPQAAVVGYNGGRLEWDTLDAFVAAVLRDGGPPPGTPYFANVFAVDITGDPAVVKLVGDLRGSQFTDYLTMLKHEGRVRSGTRQFTSIQVPALTSRVYRIVER